MVTPLWRTTSAATPPPTQTHSPPLTRTVGSQNIPHSSSISDSFSFSGVMVFDILGNWFDQRGGGGLIVLVSGGGI